MLVKNTIKRRFTTELLSILETCIFFLTLCAWNRVHLMWRIRSCGLCGSIKSLFLSVLGESEGVQPTSGVPQPSRRRKDLAATYEEAWDVKMSRRLGGMDVSRLAEALPNGNFKRYDLVRVSDRPLRSPATTAPVVRSPSLSPVLTSTEGIVMRQPRPVPRTSFRNSSTDTVINREMMPSPFRLKQNRVGLCCTF